ncbi:MAG: QueT transporter family protein [Actinobacteria bacterium]|nr:MAG: QueT transporter family protein [Actinomycetota bacterium]
MKKIDASFIARAAVIAAIYAVLTVLLGPFSYGQIQIRLSEALTPLAYVDPAAIIGLYIGCLIANFSPASLGIFDIIFGSALTLVAALSTWRISKLFAKTGNQKLYRYVGPLVATLPVIIYNAFGVAMMLKYLLKLPFLPSVGYVALGEVVAVYVVGYPLFLALMRTGIFKWKL